MKNKERCYLKGFIILFISTIMTMPLIAQNGFTYDEEDCFVNKSVRVLTYKNSYYPGRRSGIEIVQNGSRIITSIDLREKPIPIPDGVGVNLPEVISSSADRENNIHRVMLDYPALDLKYQLEIVPEGNNIRIRFILDEPLRPEADLYAMLEIYPGDYIGKSWWMDNEQMGIFPKQFQAYRSKNREGILESQPMAEGTRLVLSQEDADTRFTISSVSGILQLHDGRASSNHKWFVLMEELKSEESGNIIEWVLTPSLLSDFEPGPVIGLSQGGYHPAGPKYGKIEAGKNHMSDFSFEIFKVGTDGGEALVSKGETKYQGVFFQKSYHSFEFSDLRQPGLYRFVLKNGKEELFTISGSSYGESLWKTALSTFFPVQMCHMEVRDRIRLWHKACHLDDARRAPDGETNWLKYYQDTTQEYSHDGLEHIPGLNQGGWHDAGDFQMPAASNTNAVYDLCLSYEEFGINADYTSIDFDNRRVEMNTPDGSPDMIQQIIHGLNYLLASYRIDGYSYAGIIAGDWLQYLELGEADNRTDNIEGENEEGRSDDRYVFTSRNRNLEYKNAATFAIAYRVLKNHDPDLAAECLRYAKTAWDNGNNFDDVTPASYINAFSTTAKMNAATELYLCLKSPEYEEAIVSVLNEDSYFLIHSLWSVVRLRNENFMEKHSGLLKNKLQKLIEFQENEFDNPYGMSFSPSLFGLGYYNLGLAMKQYYLGKYFPEMFDQDLVFRVLNYYLGVHPVDNRSLITGVGEKSVTEAFGFNRSDFSYIPGGVVSGPAIIQPDFFEFRDNDPFFWIQTEYTIGSSALFIFVANAAQQIILNDLQGL